jgi:hypothetical protein
MAATTACSLQIIANAASSVGAMPEGIAPSLLPCIAGFSRQDGRGPF